MIFILDFIDAGQENARILYPVSVTQTNIKSKTSFIKTSYLDLLVVVILWNILWYKCQKDSEVEQMLMQMLVQPNSFLSVPWL